MTLSPTAGEHVGPLTVRVHDGVRWEADDFEREPWWGQSAPAESEDGVAVGGARAEERALGGLRLADDGWRCIDIVGVGGVGGDVVVRCVAAGVPNLVGDIAGDIDGPVVTTPFVGVAGGCGQEEEREEGGGDAGDHGNIRAGGGAFLPRAGGWAPAEIASGGPPTSRIASAESDAC